MRGELFKEKRDGEIQRKQIEMSNMKCDLIFQEMLRHLEETEYVFSVVTESATQNELCLSSIAKVANLEYNIENQLIDEEDLMSSWRSKVIDMIEKIDHFEKLYLQQQGKLLDHSPTKI